MQVPGIVEHNLGSMYQHGKGVRKDFREAAAWYRRAADHGHITAQCNLASLYFRGKGVMQDFSQAAAWFRTAADHGYAPAEENLAWMYCTGTGVPRNYSEAATIGYNGRQRADLRAHNSIWVTFTNKAEEWRSITSVLAPGTRWPRQAERNEPEHKSRTCPAS